MSKAEGLKLSGYSPTYREPFHESAAFFYILIILVLASLVVSVLTFIDVSNLKKSLAPATVSTKDFLNKLISHPETKNYVGVSPLNIVQITSNNLPNLQSQISGLDTSYFGNFIVQYSDKIVIYDYANDRIKGAVSLQTPQQSQLPADFFAKLNAHPELKGLETEQPVGGQIDQQSLNTLRQQFPDVYANTKAGDFLLRYKTRLIIYDYNIDKIVNALSLSQ